MTEIEERYARDARQQAIAAQTYKSIASTSAPSLPQPGYVPTKDFFMPGKDAIEQAFIEENLNSPTKVSFREFQGKIADQKFAKEQHAGFTSEGEELQMHHENLVSKGEMYAEADFAGAIFRQIQNHPAGVMIMEPAAKELVGAFLLSRVFPEIISLSEKKLAEHKQKFSDWKKLNAKILKEVGLA
jgi:hypothetical protein